MSKFTVFDVGANSGEFGIEIAKSNADIAVHLFEPNPKLCDILQQQKDEFKLSNAIIHSYAIGMSAENAVLNLSEESDCGVSSFHALNKDNIQSDDYWKTRGDLQFTETIEVEVKKLEDVTTENSITKIDFIKIDVQGMDLDVLRSLGEQLKIVEAGMIECATTTFQTLYEDEEVLFAGLEFLYGAGLQPVYMKPNDPSCNELNIFFARTPESWDEMVKNLSLSGNDIFDGKNYWFYPSSSLDANPLSKEIEKIDHRVAEQDDEVERLNNRVIELDLEIERLNNIINSKK